MYEAKPLTLTPQKATKILSEMLKIETFFNDYQKPCADACGTCDLCLHRKAAIARNLTALDAIAFEVWKDADLVGILFLTDIVPGHEANAEMTFWDGDLRGKSEIVNKMIDHVFKSLELHRLTVQVPAHMESFVKWLKKKLHFVEEGRKREARLWRQKWEDVLILGRLNGKAG